MTAATDTELDLDLALELPCFVRDPINSVPGSEFVPCERPVAWLVVTTCGNGHTGTHHWCQYHYDWYHTFSMSCRACHPRRVVKTMLSARPI